MVAAETPKTHRWVLLLLCGVLLSVAVGGSIHFFRHRDRLNDQHRARCTALARSFTGGARSWVALGQLDSLDVAANLLLEAGASGIQIAGSASVVFEAGSADTWDVLPMESWEASLHGGQSALGEGIVEVVEPLRSAASPVPYGYVRVVFDTKGVSARVRGRATLVWGAVGVAGVSVLAGALLVRRRRKRRSVGGAGDPAPFVVDQVTKRIRMEDSEIPLSRKQFLLFALLAEEAGRVYSDQEILEGIWPDSEYANRQDVKQLVYLLRRRLDQARDGLGCAVVNVKGFGYRLDMTRLDSNVARK